MILPTLLAFGSLAVSALAAYPKCQTLKVPLNITATTLNITAPTPQDTADVIATTELFISLNGPANATEQFVSGNQTITDTYYINSRLCIPADEDYVEAHANTVQLLIHGIGGSQVYWDQSFANYNYSYVAAAASKGYATLAIDRLGIGESSKPNPAQAVQTATETEIIRLLASGLKKSSLGFKSRQFNKVVGVGHSYGSIQLNLLASQTPEAIDGLVLTGYSHNKTGLVNFLAGNQVDIAKNVDPKRFSDLPNGYLLASSSYGATFVFFHSGNYNPDLGKLAYATRGTVTVGESFTIQQGYVPAPEFSAPVLTITGDRDQVFCAGACYGEGYEPIIEAEAAFWPASSNFTAIVPPATGHFLNYHYSAPAAYQQILAWLSGNGF